MYNPITQLPPGFRFHPTDEELIVHYLMNRKASPSTSIVAEVDIYKFDPWDLPEKALFGEKEWYFFSPRERKYPNGVRPNRAAISGYWKATGTDKAIRSGENNVGVKKALVFYRGKPPKGFKTNWIMHEYRLAELQNSNKYKPMCSRVIDQSTRQLDDWVLCRIYKKNKHLPPPLIDSEILEDSSTEQTYLPTQFQLPQQLPKTLSISDYLENLSQISSYNNAQCSPLLGQPISNHDNNIVANSFFLPRLSQIESSDSSFNGNLQQEDERIVKEENFAGQFNGSQYSLLNQPLFSHQLIFNSHLGFH